MSIKLRDLGCIWLKVLLADSRAMQSPRTEGIEPGNPLEQDWRTMSDKIIEAVAPNTTRLCVNLLYRWKVWKGGQDPKRPKVCILIKWDSKEDWDGAIERVQGVIAGNDTYKAMNITLEVMRGSLF